MADVLFWWQATSHVLWWAKRWDDTLTRWFPFLQIHIGLEWKWQWPYWVGNTGHKNKNNNNIYIYTYNTHVYSIETNPWDMPHPGKLTRSRGFQSSKRLDELISITTHPWLRELLYPRAFWCWFDTLHSFLVAHLLNLFDSHFCSF